MFCSTFEITTVLCHKQTVHSGRQQVFITCTLCTRHCHWLCPQKFCLQECYGPMEARAKKQAVTLRFMKAGAHTVLQGIQAERIPGPSLGNQKSLCKDDNYEAKSQRIEFNQANYVGQDFSDRRATVCAKALLQDY